MRTMAARMAGVGAGLRLVNGAVAVKWPIWNKARQQGIPAVGLEHRFQRQNWEERPSQTKGPRGWMRLKSLAEATRFMSSGATSQNARRDHRKVGDRLNAEYQELVNKVEERVRGGDKGNGLVSLLNLAMKRQGKAPPKYVMTTMAGGPVAEVESAEVKQVPHDDIAADSEGNRYSCTVTVMGRGYKGAGPNKFEAAQNAAKTAIGGMLKDKLVSRVALDVASTKRRLGGPGQGGLTLDAPVDAVWTDASAKTPKLKPINVARDVPIPELAHNLHKILDRNNSVATDLQKHRIDGVFLDREYLSKIEQPGAINWASIPPFTPTSQDVHLHQIALKSKSKYKASTSSISGLFSHVYQVMSNFRPVDTSSLSKAFEYQSKNFSGIVLRKPANVILRTKDGIIGIDAEPETDSNHQILIDLGKTLERMLTLAPDEFKKMMLKSPEGEEFDIPDDFNASTYNYSQIGDFCLRSQLDCVYGGNKIFDLKTRATHAIRNSFHYAEGTVSPKERYKLFIESYKIASQTGLYNSFEREMYDMMRSAFLKYSLQLRIGRMHGAFVTYHNTAEIFGFQYLPLSSIDKMIYGSTFMAEQHFVHSADLLSKIIETVRGNYKEKETKSIRMSLLPNPKGRCLIIESRLVENEWKTMPEPGSKDDPVYKFEHGEPTMWLMWIKTFINGKLTDEPWQFEPNDKFEVKYCLMNINDYKKVTLEEGSKMMMESSEVGPPRPGSFGKAPWMVHNPVDDNLGSRKKRSERSVTA